MISIDRVFVAKDVYNPAAAVIANEISVDQLFGAWTWFAWNTPLRIDYIPIAAGYFPYIGPIYDQFTSTTTTYYAEISLVITSRIPLTIKIQLNWTYNQKGDFYNPFSFTINGVVTQQPGWVTKRTIGQQTTTIIFTWTPPQSLVGKTVRAGLKSDIYQKLVGKECTLEIS